MLFSRLLGLGLAVSLTGCASYQVAQTSATYTAPGQAYNLDLGNAAVVGSPYLRSSCNTAGSTLELIDAAKNYYRIDYMDLNHSAFKLPEETSEDNARMVADFYRDLYESPFEFAPLLRMPSTTDNTLYFPLPLDRPGPVAKEGRVMGFAVTRHGSDLYAVQHLQQIYNQAQMAAKLTHMTQAMQVPGSFSSSTKNQEPVLGLIRFDPSTEPEADLAQWAKEAKCQ